MVRSFRDFEALQDGTTVGKTITYSDLLLFEEVSELTNRENPQRKIPETLVIMISIGLMNRRLSLDDSLIAVLSNSWSFSLPVYVDDTVHVKYSVAETKLTQKGDKGIVTLALTAFNQHQSKVAEGKWALFVKN